MFVKIDDLVVCSMFKRRLALLCHGCSAMPAFGVIILCILVLSISSGAQVLVERVQRCYIGLEEEEEAPLQLL